MVYTVHRAQRNEPFRQLFDFFLDTYPVGILSEDPEGNQDYLLEFADLMIYRSHEYIQGRTNHE